MLEIIGKVVNVTNGELIGYKITAGTEYTAIVTQNKAQKIGVADLEIAQYLDVPVDEAVPTGIDSFGLITNSTGYFSEFADIPRDEYGNMTLYYGYCFDERYLVPLDSNYAIRRVIDSANGKYFDE